MNLRLITYNNILPTRLKYYLNRMTEEIEVDNVMEICLRAS